MGVGGGVNREGTFIWINTVCKIHKPTYIVQTETNIDISL